MNDKLSDYDAGYKAAYDYRTSGDVKPYLNPENDFQRGWNAGLAEIGATLDAIEDGVHYAASDIQNADDDENDH